MENFEFKSQICTIKEQSERLLKLGLKKDTADMMIITKSNHIPHEPRIIVGYDYKLSTNKAFDTLPAWSLHRLLEMLYADIGECMIFFPNTYNEIIVDIENVIRRGTFNQDYLDDKK